MNREIKFRGKTRDGEWVYGYYLPSIYEDVDIITVLEDFNLTQKNYAVLKETKTLYAVGWVKELQSKIEADNCYITNERNKLTILFDFRDKK